MNRPIADTGLILIMNRNSLDIFHIITKMKYLLKNEANKPIVNEFTHLAICIADIEIPKNMQFYNF